MRHSRNDRRKRLTEQAGRVLADVGTPVLVFFEADMRESYDRLRTALDDQYPESSVYVAVKANFLPDVLGLFSEWGARAEAFANCEIEAAMRAGFDPGDVLVTGMNWDADRIDRALASGVDTFLVDNRSDLATLRSVTVEADRRCDVLLRVNPELDVPTHPDIATGTPGSKFGMELSGGDVMAAARTVAGDDHLRLHGLQTHLGSQIDGPTPYQTATRALVELAADVERETGVAVDTIDVGGGFPVTYDEQVPPIEEYVSVIAETVRSACTDFGIDPPELCLEPGRYLFAPSGALLCSVGLLKETSSATYAVLDTGKNTVLAQQSVPIYAPFTDGPSREYSVAGPLCYSGDVFADGVLLPELDPGDVVALDRVGAYAIGRETHFNGMPMVPVVVVDADGGYEVVRERETCVDVLPSDGTGD